MIDYFANMQTKRGNCPEKRRRKGRKRKKEGKMRATYVAIIPYLRKASFYQDKLKLFEL